MKRALQPSAAFRTQSFPQSVVWAAPCTVATASRPAAPENLQGVMETLTQTPAPRSPRAPQVMGRGQCPGPPRAASTLWSGMNLQFDVSRTFCEGGCQVTQVCTPPKMGPEVPPMALRHGWAPDPDSEQK